MAARSHKAGYNLKAPRRSVALSLNSDLLNRIEPLTHDFSATVEGLLGRYLNGETAPSGSGDEQLQAVLHAVTALHERDGFLSDEFSTL